MKMNKILTGVVSLVMAFSSFSATVSAIEPSGIYTNVSTDLINNVENLSNELMAGGEIVSRDIILQENDICIVETIIDYDSTCDNKSAARTTTYGTTTQSKVHEIYINGDYLVAKATLTASFKYDESTDYVACTSKSKNMYVTSGSSTYFNNVVLSETSGGGVLTKKYVTAYLSYGYGIAGATNKLTIKCKSDGTIS